MIDSLLFWNFITNLGYCVIYSSLSYVFSMYKLTEDRAASILCELCSTMPEKVASAGKLLFFGEHNLKSNDAKSKLQPIKDLLASSYRDDGGVSGEEIVERSQIAMGEAAYRAAVASAGKSQTELTVGWEVLGLDKETANEHHKSLLRLNNFTPLSGTFYFLPIIFILFKELEMIILIICSLFFILGLLSDLKILNSYKLRLLFQISFLSLLFFIHKDIEIYTRIEFVDKLMSYDLSRVILCTFFFHGFDKWI